MSEQYHNSIFWIEVDKIRPNPYQPRLEFDQDKLQALADSIRQYGVLQPLVVTRREVTREDGGIAVEYELIAGERRWRASKLAGVLQVPAVIRQGEESDKLKLEMAIIENLQREDLNPVERAKAFQKLAQEFSLKHAEIARRVGKSREYVSNSIRIMALPPAALELLSAGKITEGHTRPILMLADRPEEQLTLMQEILVKHLSVRDTEAIARRIAYDKVRKKEYLLDPRIAEVEQELTQKLGTRVTIDRKQVGGKVIIDFISNDDLHLILDLLSKREQQAAPAPRANHGREQESLEAEIPVALATEVAQTPAAPVEEPAPDDDLYNIKNFSL